MNDKYLISHLCRYAYQRLPNYWQNLSDTFGAIYTIDQHGIIWIMWIDEYAMSYKHSIEQMMDIYYPYCNSEDYARIVAKNLIDDYFAQVGEQQCS